MPWKRRDDMTAPSEGAPLDKSALGEESIDKARRAFDGFLTVAQKAAGQADSTGANVQSHAKSVATKAMVFAEGNVRNAFDLARKLVRAKDLQEVLSLQSDYAKTQMTVIQDQAKELGSILQTTAQNVAQSASQTKKTDSDEAVSGSRAEGDFWTTAEDIGNPRVDEAAFQPSARAIAVLRGVDIARRDLVDAGGTYDAIEVQHLLNLPSEDELDGLVNDRSILSLKNSRQEIRFPTFQFRPDGSLVDGIGSVMKLLPTQNAWAVLNFMVRSQLQLGNRRPIDLLRAGEVELVLKAAQSVGVQGT